MTMASVLSGLGHRHLGSGNDSPDHPMSLGEPISKQAIIQHQQNALVKDLHYDLSYAVSMLVGGVMSVSVCDIITRAVHLRDEYIELGKKLDQGEK
jgi:hypothetical protein